MDVEESDEQSEEEEETESEEESEEEESDVEASTSKETNSHLAVGYKTDRTFVVRGNKIGVFSYGNDEHLQFGANIQNLSTLQNKELHPEKVMLHQQDAAMLLLDGSNNQNTVYKMDVERGKVVEEWKVHDDIPVTSLAPVSKYAPLSVESTVVGLSYNSLFRIDPRLPGNKFVEAQSKMYATKNDFTCATTTEQGYIAVGNAKGEIRMFDRLGINAKAVLPALGDPILGIDVSADGRWLIATCKTYLLLVDCETSRDGQKTVGFVKGFAKDSKPMPKRLQLKPEHAAYINAPIAFTPARFNAGIDEIERSIVTSTGPYVITWNFRHVKLGKLHEYQIKKYPDVVVADNFCFGQDRNIIVTLPHQVTMATKKALKKPGEVLRK
jgi:hypothetical protein